MSGQRAATAPELTREVERYLAEVSLSLTLPGTLIEAVSSTARHERRCWMPWPRAGSRAVTLPTGLTRLTRDKKRHIEFRLLEPWMIT